MSEDGERLDPLAPRPWSQGVRRTVDGVGWRVWAPRCASVILVAWDEEIRREWEMTPLADGYFTCELQRAPAGLRYVFRTPAGEFADPASRWQPEGVHGRSAVFWPDDFAWSDGEWRGVELDELVLYELHVGTFTAEGTFDAIVPRLDDLRRLGVTALELMPVAAFPGIRNWGYDGVYPRAVQQSYGGPAGLLRLVNAAHERGMAVLLDVVFNHLGPEGNHLDQFGPYFTERYRTPWGKAMNFDGADCDAVRQYVVETACDWVRDFHLDGLRLDAVHAMYDFSARHVMAELQEAVQSIAVESGRTVHVIAESNLNDVRLVREEAQGGVGLDAVWNDDFHHSLHALLTGECDGYYRAYGKPQDLARAYNNVYVYDGRYSPYRRRRHGAPVEDAERRRFVVALQTHDQVGNRAGGERLARLVSPAQLRLACGLLLISPFTPLLFMGEEYGEVNPFPYFCSFEDTALCAAVRAGRQQDAAERGFALTNELINPVDEVTQLRAVLSWNWDDAARSGLRCLYADLLSARRSWKGLLDRQHTWATLSDDERVLTVRRGKHMPVVALANLSDESIDLSSLDRGFGKPALSTEAAEYGGARNAECAARRLLADELLIFVP